MFSVQCTCSASFRATSTWLCTFLGVHHHIYFIGLILGFARHAHQGFYRSGAGAATGDFTEQLSGIFGSPPQLGYVISAPWHSCDTRPVAFHHRSGTWHWRPSGGLYDWMTFPWPHTKSGCYWLTSNIRCAWSSTAQRILKSAFFHPAQQRVGFGIWSGYRQAATGSTPPHNTQQVIPYGLITTGICKEALPEYKRVIRVCLSFWRKAVFNLFARKA